MKQCHVTDLSLLFTETNMDEYFVLFYVEVNKSVSSFIYIIYIYMCCSLLRSFCHLLAETG